MSQMATANDSHVNRVAKYIFQIGNNLKGNKKDRDFFCLLMCYKCDTLARCMMNEMIGELRQVRMSPSDVRLNFVKRVFKDYLLAHPEPIFEGFVKVMMDGDLTEIVEEDLSEIVEARI